MCDKSLPELTLTSLLLASWSTRLTLTDYAGLSSVDSFSFFDFFVETKVTVSGSLKYD